MKAPVLDTSGTFCIMYCKDCNIFYPGFETTEHDDHNSRLSHHRDIEWLNYLVRNDIYQKCIAEALERIADAMERKV